MQRALALLAKPEVVEDARESTRRMLRDGRITLAPTADRTVFAGLVNLRGLYEKMLEIAGFQRRKLSGSEEALHAVPAVSVRVRVR